MTSLDGRRLRSGPPGPDRTPAAEDSGPSPEDARGTSPAAPAPPAPVSHGDRPDRADRADRAEPEPADPDSGWVRRNRPARGPVPAVPPPDPGEVRAVSPPSGPVSGPVHVPDPPRRPVPPTFPSPGQPPPAVARRAGRHARPESEVEHGHTPPDGYRPRHAVPDHETERFPAVVGATGPGGSGPVPLLPTPDGPPVLVGPATSPTPTGSDRVRVVLAERRAPTRAVRTVAEIEQQTETGELLLGNLLRAQLTLGLRLGAVAVLLLGALPLVFLAFPGLGGMSVLGVRLPWLLLGLAPYPVMLLLAGLYTRTAERNELDFADNVED